MGDVGCHSKEKLRLLALFINKAEWVQYKKSRSDIAMFTSFAIIRKTFCLNLHKIILKHLNTRLCGIKFKNCARWLPHENSIQEKIVIGCKRGNSND